MSRKPGQNTQSKDEIIFTIQLFYDNHKRSPKMCELIHFNFNKHYIKRLFGSWNNLLEASGVPLNKHKPVVVNCANCNKSMKREVKELKKVNRTFCSYQCNQKFYRSPGMYKHSDATKLKISESLKAHRIFPKES